MVDTVKYPDRAAMVALLDQEKIDYKIYDHEALDTMQAGLEHFSKNKHNKRLICLPFNATCSS